MKEYESAKPLPAKVVTEALKGHPHAARIRAELEKDIETTPRELLLVESVKFGNPVLDTFVDLSSTESSAELLAAIQRRPHALRVLAHKAQYPRHSVRQVGAALGLKVMQVFRLFEFFRQYESTAKYFTAASAMVGNQNARKKNETARATPPPKGL